MLIFESSSRRCTEAVALVILLVFLAVGVNTSHAQSLDDLVWLAGCWQSEDGEPGSGEQWMMPAGGLMLGMSRSIRSGSAVSFEFMRIAGDNGEFVFTAQPEGGQATVFSAVARGESSMSFENLEHDFPQRIAYARSEDRLLATIAGSANGELREVVFAMRLVPCNDFSG
ncbi:MAG: DUF6265 family protein [Congregibacter sp.]